MLYVNHKPEELTQFISHDNKMQISMNPQYNAHLSWNYGLDPTSFSCSKAQASLTQSEQES